MKLIEKLGDFCLDVAKLLMAGIVFESVIKSDNINNKEMIFWGCFSTLIFFLIGISLLKSTDNS